MRGLPADQAKAERFERGPVREEKGGLHARDKDLVRIDQLKASTSPRAT